VAALRQATLDVVKPEDLQAIIVRLVLAAQQGDVAAARLVLAYTLGKPAPAVDPDALDLHEWALWQQMPVPNEALQALLGPLQVPLACVLARTLLPLLQDTVSKQLAQQLDPAAPIQPGTDQAQQPQLPSPTESATSAPRAAPVSASTPGPATVQPSPRPANGRPTVKPKADKQPGLVGNRCAGVAAGGPNEAFPQAQTELNRWLEVCERLLFPDSSASEGPPGLAGACAPGPGLQT